MSKYIRARDGRCVVCGTMQKLTNGHLFSRVSYSTRWDEDNCACQCSDCNMRHEFDSYPFTSWYIRTYGIKKYDEVHARSKKTRLKDKDIADYIIYYKEKLKCLKNQI